MARKLVLCLVLMVFLAAAPGWAYDYGWIGNLSGLNEVPPNASPASGVIYAYLSADCDSLYYWGEWSGLVAPYTASHFHAAPAGVNGGVQLGTIGGGQTGVPFNGGAFSPANVSRLHHDSIYFNVHTSAFPGGEIRDQMHCEPDTASFDALTDVGTSHCIQLCGDAHSLIRVRNLAPGQYPVVTKRFGCTGILNPCDVNCCPTDHITEYFDGNWWWDPEWNWFCLEVSGNGCACITLDQILPVELSSFDAIAGDGQVNLSWVTASERDNDRFDIERNGTVVAAIPSQGGASGATYSWTDADVANGTSYDYALFSIDNHGNREQLAVASATPSASAHVTEYALHGNYPNPFNPETKIVFDLAEAGHVSLRVFDLLGREVARVVDREMVQGRHNVEFRADGLSSGVYLYRLEANGFADQQKMLLLK